MCAKIILCVGAVGGVTPGKSPGLSVKSSIGRRNSTLISLHLCLRR